MQFKQVTIAECQQCRKDFNILDSPSMQFCCSACEVTSLHSRMETITSMGKALSNDSCYWQGLYKSLASEEEYNNAIKKIVKKRRK